MLTKSHYLLFFSILLLGWAPQQAHKPGKNCQRIVKITTSVTPLIRHVLQVCTFQVGSFNYAMDKLIFDDEFIPVKEEAVRSILDYEIEIYPLDAEEKQYSALNMNYSVAGFKLVLARKMSFYVVTYYLPSGLFVVVSWISFLVNPEVRSHPRFCQENSPVWQS